MSLRLGVAVESPREIAPLKGGNRMRARGRPGSASVRRNPFGVLYAVVGACFLLFSLNLAAQRYSFQNYAQRDGIRNLNFNCLLQNRSGDLLVCTEFGLYRYDGSRFELIPTVEGSSSPLIQGIAEDSLGRIWVSTPQRLLYRDSLGIHDITPKEENLNIDLRTPLAVSPNDPSHIYFISHHMLMEARTLDKGNSWHVARVFNASSLSHYPPLSTIKGVYDDPDGRLWLGCGDQICEVDRGEVRLWGKAEGVPDDNWSAMLTDQRGGLWARGNHHIIQLNKKASQFVPEEADLPPSVLEMRAPCLIEDPQGRILANTANGLARWNQGNWTLFTSRNGLPGGQIQTMIFDRQGSLWFDGGKAGLQRWIGYDDWENWTTDDGLSSGLVWTVTRDSEKGLWLGTELDLEMMQTKEGLREPHRVSGKLHVRRVQSTAVTADKHLWIGSDDGSVVEYNPALGTSKLIADERNIYQILVDRNDRVWVLAASGLFMVDRSRGDRALRPPPADVVPATRFYRAVQDANGDLIFTSDLGMFRLDKDRWSHIELPAFYRPGYNAQIALGMDNTLWVSGTSPSLLQFRIHGNSVQTLSQVSVPTLTSANIYSLETDRRGWLWAGTDSGIDVFNGAEWRHVSEEDGLVWNDINTASFLSDEDGSVWIGTSGGLSHLVHPERLFYKEPLSVSVSESRLGSLELSQNSKRAVPWGHYPLTFHVTAHDYSRGHAITFCYKLTGVDDVWQETSDHDIRYSFVPDGTHRLVVIAVDKGNHRISEQQTLDFTIGPPWWRTPLFLVLLAIAVALLVVGAWRWSNRFAIARRHALERLVQERTRELEDRNASLLDARAALIDQATHDSLTGILNRGAIYSVLEKEIQRAQREKEPLVAVMADVDHFKRINDLYGHQCGDRVLQEVTRRLRSAIRTYDSLGRYGGEEFLIVFPKLGRDESMARIQRICETIEAEPVTWNQISLKVTCSFGAARLERGSDLQALIQAADQALYEAKANGRNRVEFATIGILNCEDIRRSEILNLQKYHVEPSKDIASVTSE
jgi:diguanylate cyclase (GGDEF)-like protein